jgi:hypothetical protein
MIPSWIYEMVLADAKLNWLGRKIWSIPRIPTKPDNLCEWMEAQ